MLLVWVLVSLIILCQCAEASSGASDHGTWKGEGWTDEMVELHERLLGRLRRPGHRHSSKKRRGRIDYGNIADGPDDEFIRSKLAKAQNCEALKRLDLDRKHMLEQVGAFLREYPKRPIKKNVGGMRFTHMFNLWYLVRKLNPEFFVESGVFQGQTTWLIRNALPNAEIYSFDPFDSRQFIDPKTHYQIPEGRKWSETDPNREQDTKKIFTDFSQFNWDRIEDKSKVVVLLDDHQSHLKRIKQGKEAGFKRFILDDNYYPLLGDLYSAKQVCDETGGTLLRGANFTTDQVLMADNFNFDNKFIPMEEHRANRQWFLDNVKTYHEMPPLLQVPGHLVDPSRVKAKAPKGHKGQSWDLAPLSRSVLKDMMKYFVPPPLITSAEEFEASGIKHLPPFEMGHYAFLGYVELK